MTTPGNETALVPARKQVSLDEVTAFARVLSKSNQFPHARDEYKCAAIILAGMEYGWSPVFSVMNVFITENGKLILSVHAMAAQVKASKRYDYTILASDAKGCEIEYYRLDTELSGQAPNWQAKTVRTSLGRSAFTIEEARLAGLYPKKDNWSKYPADMLYARAMSRGVKRFCPDVFIGPVYTEADDIEGSRGLGVTVNATATVVRGDAAEPADGDTSFPTEEPKRKPVKLGGSVASRPEPGPAPDKSPAPEPAAIAAAAPETVDARKPVGEPALMELGLASEMAARIACLGEGDQLTEDDAKCVRSAVTAVMGGKPGAKAAWASVGAEAAGALTRKQVVALARHLSQVAPANEVASEAEYALNPNQKGD